MNAVNDLFREQQEARAKLAAAKAALWTQEARPLLRAYVNLLEVRADTFHHDGDAASDAREIMSEAATRLHDEIEGIRDRAMMTAQGPAPASTDEAAWTAYDEHCEAVAQAVPSITDAIGATARELVDEEMRRAA